MLRIGIIERPTTVGNNSVRVRTWELFPNRTKAQTDENGNAFLELQFKEKWQAGKIINLPSYYSLFQGASLKIAAERHAGVKILSEGNQKRFLSSTCKVVCSCFPVIALLTLDRENSFDEKTDLRPYFKEIECSLVEDHE